MAVKTKTQKGIKITHEIVAGANHFFENKTEELDRIVGTYVDERMIQFEKDRAQEKERRIKQVSPPAPMHECARMRDGRRIGWVGTQTERQRDRQRQRQRQ